jgi:hypothetical protein
MPVTMMMIKNENGNVYVKHRMKTAVILLYSYIAYCGIEKGRIVNNSEEGQGS